MGTAPFSFRASRRVARRVMAVLTGAVVLLGWGATSCAPSGFQNPSLLQNGVRILASSATEPYANPGDTVGLSVLAFDGRTDAQRALNPEPMHIYWLTTLCVNPALDAYYACFPQVVAEFAPFESDAGPLLAADAESNPDAPPASEAGSESGDAASDLDARDIDAGDDENAVAGDAGDGGTNGSALPPGMAPVVSRVDFAVPPGVVVPRVGTSPYGLLIKFNIACAGHLQRLPIDPTTQNPQALPIACFDSTGRMLGAENYVIGFTRVYVHEPNGGPGAINHNPIITAIDTPQPTEQDGGLPIVPAESLAVDGGEGPPNLIAAGTFVAPRCVTDNGCPHPKIGPVVPSTSQETAANGKGEQVWAEYYSTFGSFKSTTRLLYDPVAGPIADPDTEFQPPTGQPLTQTRGLIWIVVHDNRGGAAWVTIPVQLQ